MNCFTGIPYFIVIPCFTGNLIRTGALAARADPKDGLQERPPPKQRKTRCACGMLFSACRNTRVERSPHVVHGETFLELFPRAAIRVLMKTMFSALSASVRIRRTACPRSPPPKQESSPRCGESLTVKHLWRQVPGETFFGMFHRYPLFHRQTLAECFTANLLAKMFHR